VWSSVLAAQCQHRSHAIHLDLSSALETGVGGNHGGIAAIGYVFIKLRHVMAQDSNCLSAILRGVEPLDTGDLSPDEANQLVSVSPRLLAIDCHHDALVCAQDGPGGCEPLETLVLGHDIEGRNQQGSREATL